MPHCLAFREVLPMTVRDDLLGLGSSSDGHFCRRERAQLEGVESAAGAVAVGRGVCCFPAAFALAGASVLTLAPFPAAAHRTGLADLPHPALGRASREGMHGSSFQARLMDVDHSHLPVDLDIAKAACFANA